MSRHEVSTIALLVAIVALSLACSDPQSSQGNSASPVAPTSSYEVVQEYADACGALLSKEVGAGQEFAEWAKELESLMPPPELQEFHDAHAGQFFKQVRWNADGSSVNLGGNDQAQTAERRAHEITASLSNDHRNALMDGGCLTSFQVKFSKEFVSAQERIAERLDKQESLSVDEYIEHCADLGQTMPIMGTEDAPLTHMADGLAILNPSSELERYNDALVAYYREWAEAGEQPLVGQVKVNLRLRTEQLDEDIVKAMIEGGCR